MGGTLPHELSWVAKAGCWQRCCPGLGPCLVRTETCGCVCSSQEWRFSSGQTLLCCLLRASPQVSSQWGLSRSFLGFIVLPIAGNACEHITGGALPLQL